MDWFVVNVRDADWYQREGFGAGTVFEDRDDRFPELGVNIRVLEPGERMSYYHHESAQEDFLVLGGACTLVVADEERALEAWDFVHCPAGVAHVFVGAGDSACAIVAIGTRKPDMTYGYPVSEAALRLNAGVEQETDDPNVAYADLPPSERGRPKSWDDLPWSGRKQ